MSFVWGSLFSDHEKTPVTAKSPKNSFLGKKWKLFSSRHRQLWGRVPESKRRKGRVWAVVVAGGHADDGDEDEDNHDAQILRAYHYGTFFFTWHNIMIK